MQVEILDGISRSKILAAARQPFSSIATGRGGLKRGRPFCLSCVNVESPLKVNNSCFS